MHAQTTVWETPLITKNFDWSSPEAGIVEKDVIAPAIKAAVAEQINQRLMVLNPLDRKKMRIGVPNEGWDSALRFTDVMERVMPYREVPSPFGTGWEANTDFEKWGLIVFSRNSPEGSHSFKVSRKTVREKMGQKVMVWVTVTIPDESVFETEWFRLK